MRRLTALLCALCLLTACQSAPPPESSPPVELSTPVETPAPTHAPSHSPTPAPEEDGVPAPVREAAETYAAGQREEWSHSGVGFRYVGSLPYPDGTPVPYDDWRIDALEPAWAYRDLNGCDVDVYRLDYRLHTAAPDRVTLAGGMALDEGGWLFPGYATYLCFDASGDAPIFLFALQENDCAPGDQRFTGDLTEALRVQVEHQAPASLAREAQDYLERGDGSFYRVTGLTYAGEYQVDGFTLTAYAATVTWSSDGESWIPAWLGSDGHAYVFQARRAGSVWVADVRAVPGEDLERAAVEALYHLDGLETSFQVEDGLPPRFGLGSDFPCPLGAPTATEVSAFPFAPDQAEVHTETYEGVTLTRIAPVGGDTGIVSALTVTRPDWVLPTGVRVGDSREAVAAAYPAAVGDGDALWFDPEPDALGPYELIFTFQGDALARIDMREIMD